MTSQRRKMLYISIGAIALFLILFILFNPIRTLSSFQKIQGFPLYSLKYFGRTYDFLHFTIPQSEDELNKTSGLYPILLMENQACTLFTATGGEKMIYGRNRDLYSQHSALLVYTDPPDGYASLSIVDLDQLGLVLENDQESISLIQRFLLLAAPLLPTEGMNEYGLTIAKADSYSDAVRPFDPTKDSLLFRTAMREVLDHARTTEEAIDLLNQYNIAFGETGGHFLIADPSGDSAIVEYFDNQVQIIRSPNPWQVMTNFNVGQLEKGETPDCQRYIITEESMEEAKGQVSSEEALIILEQASIPETLWSVVYNMTDKWLNIAVNRNYDEIYHATFNDW